MRDHRGTYKPMLTDGKVLPLRRKLRVRLIAGRLDSPCWAVVTRSGGLRRPHYYVCATRADGVIVVAHRWAWAGYHGREIPFGYVIHHRCFRGDCINPQHLAMVTDGENSRLNNFEARVIDMERAA